MSGDPRLLVLSPVFHGYWRSIERAFSTLGYAVATLTYDAHPRWADRARAKVGHDLVERLGGSSAPRRAEHTARAVEAVHGVDPDVVLVVKGDTFDAPLWEALDGRPRALWLYDELRRTGHTAASLAAAGPLASYSPHDVATLAARGLSAAHVPLAHDPDVSFTSVPSDEVVFVGARYPGREALLSALAQHDVPVRAHGRDWSGHPVDRLRTWRLHQPAVPHGRDLDRTDAYATMAGARATLNVHGDQDGFTMRTFEACGVGAVQLVDRADVSRHYEPGVELAVFGSVEEAAELARRAAADRAWAQGLRTAGRARTLAEHTFVHRARDLEALWRA
ncbi:MAG: glycosyltransferase [Ornithinibacter sp.]